MLNTLLEMNPGEINYPKILQFAACLLNQPLPGDLSLPLQIWCENQTSDIQNLRQVMLDKLNTWQNQQQEALQPSLMIKIEPHKITSGRYYVNAWFVDNHTAYNSKTGEGAKILNQVEPDQGIYCTDIPSLISDYLDQIGYQNIGGNELPRMRVEIFAPLDLLNEPFDNWIIPDKFGFSRPLAKDCCVTIRSFERLEGYRFQIPWEQKWKRLQQLVNSQASEYFIPAEGNIRQIWRKLESVNALGLTITKVPGNHLGGELALLIRTGTPAAIWVRHQLEEINCKNTIDEQILSSNLGEISHQVDMVRRNAPELEEKELQNSHNIGHHLSFLWEDPNLVPPTVFYSTE